MNSENNILELYIRVSNWAQVLNANKNVFVFTQKKEKKVPLRFNEKNATNDINTIYPPTVNE